MSHISTINKREVIENPNRKIIYVKYVDHLLFKDSETRQYELPIIEAVGWITNETENWIRIVCERQSKIPNAVPNLETGFVICKKCILEVKTLCADQTS